MIRRLPRSTRTATLFPSPTLFRSRRAAVDRRPAAQAAAQPAAGLPRFSFEYFPPGTPAAEERFRDTVQRLGALSPDFRSEEHTSELQSLMRISYAVFCLKKKKLLNFNYKCIIHTK